MSALPTSMLPPIEWLELTASDWFSLNERRFGATVDLRQIDGCPEQINSESELPVCIGRFVKIDGEQYVITGIDYTRTPTSTIKPEVNLLVRQSQGWGSV